MSKKSKQPEQQPKQTPKQPPQQPPGTRAEQEPAPLSGAPVEAPAALAGLPAHIKPLAEVDADELFERWAREDAPPPPARARHPALLAMVLLMSCFLTVKTWPAMEALLRSGEAGDCGAPLDRALARARGEQVRPFQHLERCELTGVVQHMSLFAIGSQESPDAPTEQERMRGVSFVTKLSGESVFVILPAEQEWVHAYRLKNGSLFGLEFKARGLMVHPREEPVYQRLAEQVRHNFYVPEEEDLWIFDVSYSPWDHKMPLLTFALSPLIALIALFGLRRSLAQRAAGALVALVALALPSPARAEAPAPSLEALALEAPFLWEATCSRGRAYLFGTMHLPDPRFARLHPRLLAALEESAALYGELDLRDKAAFMPKMLASFTLPEGETLEGRVGAEGYAVIVSFLNDKGLAPILAGVSRFHPSLVEITLSMLDVVGLASPDAPVVDQALQVRAEALGKTVGGVERVEEQISALLSMTDAEATEALIHTVRELHAHLKRGENPFTPLIEAYFSGDVSRVASVIRDQDARGTPGQRRQLEALLNRRNERMAARLVALLSPEAPTLFAFGVAHFILDDAKTRSVITSLKGVGCAVERLTPPAAPAAPAAPAVPTHQGAADEPAR